MNPFLWLLFILAAAVTATIVIALVIGVRNTIRNQRRPVDHTRWDLSRKDGA